MAMLLFLILTIIVFTIVVLNIVFGNIMISWEYEGLQVVTDYILTYLTFLTAYLDFIFLSKVKKSNNDLTLQEKFVRVRELMTLEESNRLDSTKLNNNLIELIANVEVLKLAYELIKSNPGNMTKGSTNETLDGIDEAWFVRTSRSILSGSFKFGPGRVVNIPKPNNPSETRKLVIASPREKVIQKAMQLVLQAIFEPMFTEYSFGFRPNLGCHDAIKHISQHFKNRNWIIESDITKCFDKINHDLLMGYIRERVSCDKTLQLISSLIKSGQVSFKNLSPSLILTDSGTPQGCILSPLLCNIYLHK